MKITSIGNEPVPALEQFTVVKDKFAKILIIFSGGKKDLPELWQELDCSEEVRIKANLERELEAKYPDWHIHIGLEGAPKIQALKVWQHWDLTGYLVTQAGIEIDQLPEPWNNPRRVQSSIAATFGNVWECIIGQYEGLVDLRGGDFSQLLSATEVADPEDEDEDEGDYDEDDYEDEDYPDEGEISF